MSLSEKIDSLKESPLYQTLSLTEKVNLVEETSGHTLTLVEILSL
jgi:hypothetical protein